MARKDSAVAVAHEAAGSALAGNMPHNPCALSFAGLHFKDEKKNRP
jgi:hypothetical protein